MIARLMLKTYHPKNVKQNKPMNIVYFGSSPFSIFVLNELKSAGIVPALIVTTPPRPQGRKLVVTPTPVKEWADTYGIPTLEPEKIRTPEFEEQIRAKMPESGWDVFIVASYGKIIPENILYLPSHKTLNVHPSLLPLLRGPAPIEYSILLDMKDTGVSIMRLDKEMDHGPIIAQEKIIPSSWPLDRITFEKELGQFGGQPLARVLPLWIAGTISEREQDHNKATFTKKISKEEALLDFTAPARINLLKIKAYTGWPKAFFFDEHKDPSGVIKKTRIVVTNATINEKNELTLLSVIPEGKKEISWSNYISHK